MPLPRIEADGSDPLCAEPDACANGDAAALPDPAALEEGCCTDESPAEPFVPPPCFYWPRCRSVAAMEKCGRSVCAACARHLRGWEYPLRPPARAPLYSSDHALAEALGLFDE